MDWAAGLRFLAVVALLACLALIAGGRRGPPWD